MKRMKKEFHEIIKEEEIKEIKITEFITEDLRINDIDNTSINTTNHIYGQGADGPFKEDFANEPN